MNKQEAILTRDILSNFHKGKDPKCYGKRGEKVKLISNHGNVWIVKSGDQQPFSVNIQSLKI